MFHTPTAVLRSMAHRLGCSVAEIEQTIEVEMGGAKIVRHADPVKRLDAIRAKLMTPEGESVIDSAARIRPHP